MENYPNLNEEVGGSIPGCKISSLLDKLLVRWSTSSCALTLTCRFSISKKKEKELRCDEINLQLTLTLYSKISVGHINCCSRELM